MNTYRNTPEYREWKEKVKKRDGDLCRSCQNKSYLDVHHIFRVESHPHLSDHIDNGITLCKNCHAKLKNKENDIDFLVEVVTQPLREQMDRLSQTIRSLERVVGVSQSEDSLIPEDDLLDSDLIVIPAQFDNAYKFSEGLASVRVGDSHTGKYEFINQSGEVVIPVQFDNAYSFSEGLAHVRVGDSRSGQYGCINRSGEVVIPAQFDYVDNFSEGLAHFGVSDSRSGQYGFIDQSGEVVIPVQFDYAYSFSEGLASFRVGDSRSRSGQYGFIRNPLNT